MKTAGQIESRIRELLLEELERRLTREVLPHLCVHNHRQPLDHRRSVYGEPNSQYNRISAGTENGVSLPVVQTIGLCMLGAENPETWAGTICEEPLDAQRCPYFVFKQSKENVYQEFLADVQRPGWVAEQLPSVQSLLWVIESSVTLRENRFRRLWARLFGFLTGAQPKKSVDISVYLPALDESTGENDVRASADH